MDLIFRHANLPDGRTNIDVGIEGQTISAVAENLPATAALEIDAKGRL
jgi:cytosine deaminase